MKLYAAELNFRDVAREMGIPEKFPDAVHAEGAAVRDRRATRRDMRQIPLVTIDPVGSMDLDQAMFIEEAAEEGWHIYYAIADVGGLVDPESQLAAESMRRGQTIYLPDEPTRLHPAELSEGAGSLLPNQDRVAALWDIVIDREGEPVQVDVYPALVRSVARLDYVSVQESFDAGHPHPSIALLPEVGQARQQSSLRREAINLRLPSQSVEPVGDGRYELSLDPRPPVMDYNSEISLLAGMVAGQLMAEAGVGVLRVLKPADKKAVSEFLVAAQALGFNVADVDGDGTDMGDVGVFLAGVDAESPSGMAVMNDATRLLRGSGYVRLDSYDGEAPTHAGVGGAYAHVTAPLRRLIDRFGLEYCLAIAAYKRGEAESIEVPRWVTDSLDDAIAVMQSSASLAATVDKKCLNLTESVVLQPWVGNTFQAAVLHQKAEHSEVFIETPPVTAMCVGHGDTGLPKEGTSQLVTLVTANPTTAEVVFTWPAD